MSTLRACASVVGALLYVQRTNAQPPPPTAPPATLNGATPDGRAGCEGDRTLDGNTFLFPVSFPSAFVTNHAGVRANVRYLNVPDVPTLTRNRTLELVGATNVVDLGIKLDERWGLFLTGTATGLAGSNQAALIYEPGNYFVGIAGGGKWRLGRWESTQVALRASGGYAYGKIIGFAPLFGPTGVASGTIDGVISGIQGESLRTPVKVVSFDLGLSMAQALGAHFSLQGDLAFHPSWTTLELFDFGTGQRGSQTTTVWGPSLGIAFAADGAPDFPLAGMFEYTLTRRTAGETLLAADEAATVHALTLGVYYTGATRLQLGVFSALELNLPPVTIRQGTSDSGNGELVGLVLRYLADTLR